MALYEEQQAANILTRMLARVGAKYDKRTGSIIFNSTAPSSEEFDAVYRAFDFILDGVVLPDTAKREYLIRHCATRGIAPFAATACKVIGKFAPAAQVLEAGERFNCGEFFYQIIEKITDPSAVLNNPDTTNFVYYYLECETLGEAPNATIGRLIPIENIDGLGSAEIVEVSVFGEDEEDTEALRQRFYDSFGSMAFGGNRTDYKNKILAMNGVGGVKLYSAWNGGGTSLAVITAIGNVIPSQTLVNAVQAAIDPDVIDGENVQGLGYGLAPIGHYCTVMGANTNTVNVSTYLTYGLGYSLVDVQDTINQVLNEYYAELNANWMHTNNVIVRIAEINARLLAIDHIVDIAGTTLNGSRDNVTIDANSLAIRGTFSANNA